MKKLFQDIGPVAAFVVGWLFMMLALAFFVQTRDYYGGNKIVRPRLEVQEAFQSGGKVDPRGTQDATVRSVMPADADLENPRAAYLLLRDWLPQRSSTPGYPTAQRCHDSDFQTRLEKTGNFRQLTNNYKRGDPDSCSGAPEELTLAFYEVQPLEQNGCI
jgi:hypothetical protein